MVGWFCFGLVFGFVLLLFGFSFVVLFCFVCHELFVQCSEFNSGSKIAPYKNYLLLLLSLCLRVSRKKQTNKSPPAVPFTEPSLPLQPTSILSAQQTPATSGPNATLMTFSHRSANGSHRQTLHASLSFWHLARQTSSNGLRHPSPNHGHN